jgi:hypothetical protein
VIVKLSEFAHGLIEEDKAEEKNGELYNNVNVENQIFEPIAYIL